MNYARLVREYLTEYWLHSKAWLEPYKRMELDEAIECAAMACGPDCKKHPHQWRLKRAVLRRAARKLLTGRVRIEGSKTFSELHDAVASLTNNVVGFGELAKYDTALRIGVSKHLKPKHVYLHAGTRHGARAVSVNDTGPVDVSRFPPALRRRLTPTQIEDFLCIYKDVLGGRARVPKGNSCYPPKAVTATCGGGRSR